MLSRRSIWGIFAVALAMPLLAMTASAAQYQGGPMGGRRGPMSPDDRLKQMTKDFNLTPDQQTKIKPILVDEQKKMEDLRNESAGDRQAMRSKMMQIQKDTNAQIRALLDDKQKEKFDKQEQEREQRMQNWQGRQRGQGGPPPQN